MSNGVQILRKVVGNVEFGANVRDDKLSLSNTITHPMKTHVDGFGAFLLDRVRGDTDRTCVLSHMRIVGGWGCPISAKIVRRLAACWAPANRAEYSASPALATSDAGEDGGKGVKCAVDF